MPVVRGCNLPEDRIYDVENHIWFQELDDGNPRIGKTAVAAALAGQLVAVTPKKVGRSVKPGKSCATIGEATAMAETMWTERNKERLAA